MHVNEQDSEYERTHINVAIGRACIVFTGPDATVSSVVPIPCSPPGNLFHIDMEPTKVPIPPSAIKYCI